MDAKTLGAMPAGPTMVYERDNYGRVKLEGKHIQKKGATLRQHYAGLAMQGLLANPGGPVQANMNCGWDLVNCNHEHVAQVAVQFADALLSELAKEPDNG